RSYIYSTLSDSPRHPHLQMQGGWLTSAGVGTVGSLAVIPGVWPGNVGHEKLPIAIIKREPTGLDLYHDAVSGEEHVVRCGQVETVDQRFVGRQRFRSLQALAIAAAEDVGGIH